VLKEKEEVKIKKMNNNNNRIIKEKEPRNEMGKEKMKKVKRN